DSRRQGSNPFIAPSTSSPQSSLGASSATIVPSSHSLSKTPTIDPSSFPLPVTPAKLLDPTPLPALPPAPAPQHSADRLSDGLASSIVPPHSVPAVQAPQHFLLSKPTLLRPATPPSSHSWPPLSPLGLSEQWTAPWQHNQSPPDSPKHTLLTSLGPRLPSRPSSPANPWSRGSSSNDSPDKPATQSDRSRSSSPRGRIAALSTVWRERSPSLSSLPLNPSGASSYTSGSPEIVDSLDNRPRSPGSEVYTASPKYQISSSMSSSPSPPHAPEELPSLSPVSETFEMILEGPSSSQTTPSATGTFRRGRPQARETRELSFSMPSGTDECPTSTPFPSRPLPTTPAPTAPFPTAPLPNISLPDIRDRKTESSVVVHKETARDTFMQAKEDREKQVREERDRQAMQARVEHDRQTREERDRQTREERDRQIREERDRQAIQVREERDRQAREEHDRQAREDRDRQAKEERDRQAREERGRQAMQSREERDRQATQVREERDRQPREEYDRQAIQAREERDRQAMEERDRQAREERDRQAREERDRRGREERDRQAREEHDRQAREERGRLQVRGPRQVSISMSKVGAEGPQPSAFSSQPPPTAPLPTISLPDTTHTKKESSVTPEKPSFHHAYTQPREDRGRTEKPTRPIMFPTSSAPPPSNVKNESRSYNEYDDSVQNV
ncbi:hypothetical protein EVG20_g4397, partial [Dentipellis fragilis]